MKRLIKSNRIVFLLIFSIFAMIACSENANTSNDEAELHIGFAMPNASDEFLSYIETAARDYEKTVDNVKVSYVDAESDSSKQMSQIETFITQKVDAIVYLPVDVSSAPNVLQMGNDADIPIIVVNREFPEMDQATSYVGGIAIESGVMQMEEIAKLSDGKGNIAVIRGKDGEQAARDRIDGNNNVLKEYEDLNVILEASGDWERAKGMELMENWLNSGEQIDIVATHNDQMAMGAIMAAEAVNKLDDITFVTIDAMPETLELIKSDKLAVAIHQDAIGQGKVGLEIAIKAAKGENVDKVYEVPYEVVVKDNVKEFEEKW